MNMKSTREFKGSVDEYVGYGMTYKDAGSLAAYRERTEVIERFLVSMEQVALHLENIERALRSK